MTFIPFANLLPLSGSQSRKNIGLRELEIETQVAQMLGKAHTKAPGSSLLEPSEPGTGEDKTYLLFTTGSLTYSPHQIGNADCFPRNIRVSLTVLDAFILFKCFYFRYKMHQARPDDHERSSFRRREKF